MCRQVLRKKAGHLMAHRLLGFSLGQQREIDAAIKAYKQALAIWPDDAELLINFAHLLVENAKNEDALPMLEKVCAIKPHQANSWLELASCCYLLGLHEKGLEAALKATDLASTPYEHVAALCQKAIHRRELGQVQEAVRDCEAAIAINPRNLGSHTNRLLFMLADPTVDASALARAAREYAAVFEPPLKPLWPGFAEHRGDPWRRLRVGFLSPDFRVHAVMYFVEGVLAQLDRRQFEVFAFYLYPRDDHVTQRVQRHADHFIRLAGLDINAQTQIVRDQRIDILIDLAGHTGHNGLLIMARKAAPVQATWVGFPGTTGLSAVDYLITDSMTDPIGVDNEYSERLYRLPTRLCAYRPMSRNPLWRYQPRYLVQPTPAISTGYVTFGSCNNLGKITDEVLSVWGKILAETPNSRLLIEGKNFDRTDFSLSYLKRCEDLGIDSTRIDLIGLNTNNQYLTYHKIDIALDPFPLNGGTTSMDVLWMGVPLVAMAGLSFKSRLTAGILLHLGRPEWLAQSHAQYIEIASSLATDVHALNQLRLGLRSEAENSVLMREDLFCHHFGEALRTMWQTWLAQAEYPDDSTAQLQALQSWTPQRPTDWATSAVPGVGLEPGKRVTIHEAHRRLEDTLARAKAALPQARTTSGQIENPRWAELTELAETVLSAVPHDPVALTCLAEVEFAHGHTDFAVTYLRHATESMRP
ncbi:tetratricopeptide repeat protein [Rhodoferax sp.]|uniref:O-linked N-acetylglucosamine transferase, SPINDLY family protein n=1 Tax=Rhodoferax sp. TaxID=50421 RepID=UPI00274A3C9D|nr:tetratricopeptide repeat protein [Rhodoferax sp.]